MTSSATSPTPPPAGKPAAPAPAAPPARNTGMSGVLSRQGDISLAVNAFVLADKAARDGNDNAAKERHQHLRTIQKRFWLAAFAQLSSCLARRKGGAPEFSDSDRLFLDMGLVDSRMLGGDERTALRNLTAELKGKDAPGSFYVTDWLLHRRQQLDLESDISNAAGSDGEYASQLDEVRRRLLSRLAGHLTGLPGIPLEAAESMRSGALDRAVIAAGLQAMRDPRRGAFIRRRNLWSLREQILTKARARVADPGELRLFELLNEVYTRDWRGQFDAYSAAEEAARRAPAAAAAAAAAATAAAAADAAKRVDPGGRDTEANPNVDALMSEARQIRMGMFLAAVVDGLEEPEVVLYGEPPRVTRRSLVDFAPVAQAFDKRLAELPPALLLPMQGRGFFEWDRGVLLIAQRPVVGPEDSIATALAWYRMLDDMLNGGGELRGQFEERFPGADWRHDFPADYRAWLTRLTKGDATAMSPDRRAFFRDCVGPEITGPMLPANLRNVGPQTMVAICQRLEKQLATADADARLHRRLAALYWHQGNAEAAGLQFNAAMQAGRDDAETFFCAGMFMRGQGDGDAATDCFRMGAERGPAGGMWGIYCRDALENMF